MRTVARCWKSASTRPSVTVGEQLVLRDQDREFDRPAVDRLAYRFQFLQLLCDAVYHGELGESRAKVRETGVTHGVSSAGSASAMVNRSLHSVS